MGDSGFDPYYEWLGIQPSEQPADLYRLLGIARFEQNASVIQRAADRQMGYVRQFQAKHPAEVSQILSELSSARITLTHGEKKLQYDNSLRNHRVSRRVAAQAAPARTSQAPDNSWYVQIMGIPQGPHTFEELQSRVRSRDVDRETLVRQGRNGRWMLAVEVRGLFDFRSPSPPPPGTETPQVAPLEPLSQGPDLMSAPLPGPEDRTPGPNVWVCDDCRWLVPKPKKHCPRCGYVKRVNDTRATEDSTAVFLLLIVAAIVLVLLAGLSTL